MTVTNNVLRALESARVWLTPPCADAADRAAAAYTALRNLDAACADLLRAGIVSHPDDELAGALGALSAQIEAEAAALSALALLPGEKQENAPHG